MIDIVIVAAILGGGTLAIKLLSSKGSDPEADAFWRAAARRVGGELSVFPGSWFRSAKRTIHLTCEDVPLVVDAFDHGDGRTYVECTRVVAGPLPAAGDAKVVVTPRGVVRRVSRKLGIAETLTGDERFDEAFHVTGGSALALAYLDAPTRRLLCTTAEGFELQVGALCIVREGAPTEAETLVDMTRFAERLVERWCALARAHGRLAAALALVGEEDFVIPQVGESVVARGTRHGRPTTLLVRVVGERLQTVVAFEGGEVTFDGLEPDPDEVSTSLDAAVEDLGSGAAYR